jgi:transposase InsO family protein
MRAAPDDFHRLGEARISSQLPRLLNNKSSHRRRAEWKYFLERLIGSIRHECLDHLIAFNAEHLLRILAKYATYYNEVRTHVSLGKGTPCTGPIERFGDVVAYPILGGLHHRYARI